MTTPTIPVSASVTHAHLLAAANTELHRRQPGPIIRVLDAGCGNGRLIGHVHQGLQTLWPDRRVEVYGFDVADHGVQPAGFFDETIAALTALDEGVDWGGRLHLITTTQDWPFADGTFDLVLSNQVLEHVVDKPAFFAQIARVLTPTGASLHLFPVSECLYEGHLRLPLIHRLSSFDSKRDAIAALSRLGFGKYAQHREQFDVSLDEFAEEHADYVTHWTSYSSQREISRAVVGAGLRCSFRYTPDFYRQKALSMRRLPPRTRYRESHRGAIDSAAMSMLRYVSSISLVAEKGNSYVRRDAH